MLLFSLSKFYLAPGVYIWEGLHGTNWGALKLKIALYKVRDMEQLERIKPRPL